MKRKFSKVLEKMPCFNCIVSPTCVKYDIIGGYFMVGKQCEEHRKWATKMYETFWSKFNEYEEKKYERITDKVIENFFKGN